jgi:hypothetical protein
MEIPGDAVMGKGNSRLRSVANADGAAILDTEAGQITRLNSTGALVWKALERGEGVESIAANLATETGQQIEGVRKDMLDFIDALRRLNLLSR